jgi:hypothetical protein
MRTPSAVPISLVAIAAASTVLACSSLGELPTETVQSGDCYAITNVGGVYFGYHLDLAMRTYEQGEVVATVTNGRGCEDILSRPVEELSPGESNHLATGTKLCAVVGFPTSKRLMMCDQDTEYPRTLTSELPSGGEDVPGRFPGTRRADVGCEPCAHLRSR